VGQLLHGDFLTPESHFFPGGTGRSEKLQLAEWEIPLLKAKEHFDTDGTRRTNNRYMGMIHFVKPAFFAGARSIPRSAALATDSFCPYWN